MLLYDYVLKLISMCCPGFEAISGGQTSMLEGVTRTADADQQLLNQVQQTAASGEAHVQGELDCYETVSLYKALIEEHVLHSCIKRTDN